MLSELDGFAVAWDTPIGQNRCVLKVGARGRIRIPKIFRARENVSRCIAAAPKKSGIGYVLSELDDFAVASINRNRAVRLLSRIYKLNLYDV